MYYNTEENAGSNGVGYYNKFKKRWAHELQTKTGQKYDLDRSEWTTYQKISNMYDLISNELIECKIAKKIKPVWMDKNGKEVSEKMHLVAKLI